MPPDQLPVVPDCRRCRHFFITYEPRRPQGCRAYGFRSREAPAQAVRHHSGQPCLLFAAR
jgi:hypothetical protein